MSDEINVLYKVHLDHLLHVPTYFLSFSVMMYMTLHINGFLVNFLCTLDCYIFSITNMSKPIYYHTAQVLQCVCVRACVSYH